MAALAKKRYQAASSHLLNVEQFKSSMVKHVHRVIKEESIKLASRKFSSKFRLKSVSDLSSVKLTALNDELMVHAPFTYNALLGICQKTKNDKDKKSDIRRAIAFAILIFQRNKRLNLVQSLISVLLYKAKARVKVYRNNN